MKIGTGKAILFYGYTLNYIYTANACDILEVLPHRVHHLQSVLMCHFQVVKHQCWIFYTPVFQKLDLHCLGWNRRKGFSGHWQRPALCNRPIRSDSCPPFVWTPFSVHTDKEALCTFHYTQLNIWALFCMTIAGSHFLSTHVTYIILSCSEQCVC
jgi:hypothetical protein